MRQAAVNISEYNGRRKGLNVKSVGPPIITGFATSTNGNVKPVRLEQHYAVER